MVFFRQVIRWAKRRALYKVSTCYLSLVIPVIVTFSPRVSKTIHNPVQICIKCREARLLFQNNCGAMASQVPTTDDFDDA